MRITEKDQKEIHYLAQQAEITSLKSRIADLERDGERLDWLEKLLQVHPRLVLAFGDEDEVSQPSTLSMKGGHSTSDRPTLGITLRDTIDRDISSQKPDGGGSGK